MNELTQELLNRLTEAYRLIAELAQAMDQIAHRLVALEEREAQRASAGAVAKAMGK